MIKPTNKIKVNVKATVSITGKMNGSTIVVEPELEDLEVTPKTEEQVFKSKKYGFDNVKVNGVTAAIDEDIKPENIKVGVNILGVDGGYEGIDTSDATATSNDILEGKTAYADNKKIEGAIQKYDGAYSGEVETVSEIEKSFVSLIDDSKGANVTKIPEYLTVIGSYTFYGRTNLALKKLPQNLTSIEYNAFDGCTNLALQELPVGITSIANNCFSNCKGITRMICKGDVSYLGMYAFRGTSLETFALPNVTKVPTLSSYVFNETPIASGTGYIYVPDDLVDSFKIATKWSTYANQIKPISELEV